MGEQMVFKRYEIKYRLTKTQKNLLLEHMREYMMPDSHGKNTTLSLYMDTPDFLLARRSMEHPEYKEKLRLRSYGVADKDSNVFIELKKKYDGIVYKRRASMREEQLERYLREGEAPEDSQIMRELSYALQRYEGIRPKVLLCYDREAFYAKDDHEFRITFDENILWRDVNVTLTDGIYGERLVDEDTVLMEIKVKNVIPLWLARFMSGQRIYKSSFSKYVAAYKMICLREWENCEAAQGRCMYSAAGKLAVRTEPQKTDTGMEVEQVKNGGTFKYA